MTRYYIARNNFIFVKRYFNFWQRNLFLIKYLFLQFPIMILFLLVKERNFKTIKDYSRGVGAGISYWKNKRIKKY